MSWLNLDDAPVLIDPVVLRRDLNQHGVIQAFVFWGTRGRVAQVARVIDGGTAGVNGPTYAGLLLLKEYE